MKILLKPYSVSIRRYLIFIILLSTFLVVLINVILKNLSPTALPYLSSNRDWSTAGNVILEDAGAHVDFSTRSHEADFLIRTPGCSIPDFSLDDPSIARFRLLKHKVPPCPGPPALTYVQGLSLHINATALTFYPDAALDRVSCCYEGIRRVEQSPDNYDLDCDIKWSLTGNCTAITGLSAHRIEEDGVLVRCYKTDHQGAAGEEPFYKDVHTFMQPRRAKQKLENFMKSGGWPVDNEIFNVIIVGNDAVSRMNLMRYMPKTFHYLTNEMDAIDFRGYSKVADNTYPNMISTLMGMSLKEYVNHSCSYREGHSISKYDDCPIIWKHFSKNGYVTAYAEDSPKLAVFNDDRMGFVKEPTDYYRQPYGVASEETIANTRTPGVYFECQGSRSSTSVIMNYALDFTQAMNDVPHFGFFWVTTLTHDNVEDASAADDDNYQMLKKWNELNLSERTILLFLSDHGIRIGDIRSTYLGMLEERLPYVMMVLPKRFKNKYPDTWNILQTNSRRLVSNYDLYLTMQDIANRGIRTSSNPVSVYGHGQSLLREVPEDRTCEDAGIPDHWCSCHETKPVDTNGEVVQKAAQFVVKTLNKDLAKYDGCSQLKLSKVMRARKGLRRDYKQPAANASLVELYYISLATVPGGAHFDATVMKEGDKMALSAHVSRINAYGEQGHCIEDDFYKLFCYCKDMLPGYKHK